LVSALIDRNIQLQPTTTRLIQAGGSARLAGSSFLLAIGSVFLIYGLTTKREMSVITVLGVCFLVYGLFQLLWSRRLSASKMNTKIDVKR